MTQLRKNAAGGGGRPRKYFDERAFRRIDKLAGVDREWKDWSFQIKSALRGTNKLSAEIANWIERADGDIGVGDIETKYVDEDGIDHVGAEF